MKRNRRYSILTRAPILLLILWVISILNGCRAGEERFELTNYLGSSIDTFKRRTGATLEETSNGVYVLKDQLQIIVTDDGIASVMLLNKAEDYTIFGIGIGTASKDAEQILTGLYEKEIDKTITSSNNYITYSYIDGAYELYVSYDIDKNQVAEMSYYYIDNNNKEETLNGDNIGFGQLIAMIGDQRVYYNEAMVYLKAAQEIYETEYGSEIWDIDIYGDGSSFGDLIKDEVIKQITELKIIKAEAAKRAIDLNNEEVEEANSNARKHFNGLSNKDIDKYYITEELLQNVYQENLLAEKVFETITLNVDNNVPSYEANQITVQHILIYGVDFDDEGNMLPFSSEEKTQAYDKVQSLWEQARETDNFYALAQANTQASEIQFTFGRGKGPKEYDSAFEQAAFTLKTGEVSDIISTDYGWHIIYCVTDYDEDATIAYKEQVIEQRRNNLFTSLYSQWASEYEVIVNSEVWRSIPFD